MKTKSAVPSALCVLVIAGAIALAQAGHAMSSSTVTLRLAQEIECLLDSTPISTN